jgi:hypothetical protein
MRRPAAFRQSDLTKAIKAAKAAGVEIDRFEIGQDGRITVVTCKPAAGATATNEWDTAFDGNDQAKIR